MNDICPLCEKEWDHGDFAVVIGVILDDQTARLDFAHRECIARHTLGDETVDRIIATQPWGPN